MRRVIVMAENDFNKNWVEYCKERKKALEHKIEDLKLEIEELESEIRFYEKQIKKIEEGEKNG